MQIEKTKVLNVDRYLNVLPPGSTFKVISRVDDKALQRAGFPASSEEGTLVLPRIVGRVSRFNAEGKWIVRRDLPKEERYVGSREFRRVEWHGQDRVEVEDTVDYYRMCYPRELQPPPAVELALVNVDGEQIACTATLTYSKGTAELNKHTINLMLELFGACEIVLEDLARLDPPSTKRVNWMMLPPGEHPWSRIEEHIKEVFSGRAPSVSKAVLARQEVILSYGPSSVFRGLAGFSDYIAYEFKGKGMVVLESVFYGNALYLFGERWEELSQRTKAEIIQHGLAEHRIIHSKGWVVHLAEVMRPKAAE